MPASSARGPTRTAAHWWWWWQGEGQLENTYKRVIEDVKLALFGAQKFPSGTSTILSLNKEVVTTKTLRERNSDITETGFRYKILREQETTLHTWMSAMIKSSIKELKSTYYLKRGLQYWVRQEGKTIIYLPLLFPQTAHSSQMYQLRPWTLEIRITAKTLLTWG